MPRVTHRTRVPAVRSAALVVLALVTGCTPSSTSSPTSPRSSASDSPARTPTASAALSESLVIVGRIVTMDEPSVAEAILIEDGTVAASVKGTRCWRLPASTCRS